jgi:hypothetical protein
MIISASDSAIYFIVEVLFCTLICLNFWMKVRHYERTVETMETVLIIRNGQVSSAKVCVYV